MCHRIEDDYQHLAHDYLNVDDVVIARVDSSKNEIKDIVPADFPMIVLYKAGGDGESQALFKADQITYNGLKQFVEKNRVVVNLPKKIESAEPKEEAAKEEVKEEVKEAAKEEAVKEASKEEAKEATKEEAKEEPVEIDVEEVCLGPDGPCNVEVDEVIIEEPKQKSKEEPKKEEPKQKAKEEPKKEKPAKKVDEGVCSGSGDSCSIDPEEEEIIEEIEEEIKEVVEEMEEMEKEEKKEKKEKPTKNVDEGVCFGPDDPCSVEVEEEVIIEEPKQKAKEEPKQKAKEEPKQKSKEEPKHEVKEEEEL